MGKSQANKAATKKLAHASNLRKQPAKSQNVPREAVKAAAQPSGPPLSTQCADLTRAEKLACRLNRIKAKTDITFQAARYASALPALWQGSPLTPDTIQHVHLHHVAVYKNNAQESTFQLVTVERLPAFLLQDGQGSLGVPYRILSVAHVHATPAQKATWIQSTLALSGTASVSERTSWPWLVAIGGSYRDAKGQQATDPSHAVISHVVGAIERQLLVADFNTLYLGGRAQQEILRKALVIQVHHARMTSQNRGEVLGDALCEVLLVADRVTKFLGQSELSQNAWRKRRKGIQHALTNRSMLSSSVS